MTQIAEATAAPTPDELPDNPIEDQFRSLLEGLRTTLPGVQLIAAFLLTVPFYDHWDDLVHLERLAYYVAFGSALLSSLLLMAPSSHQRLRAESRGSVARHSTRHLAVAVRLTVIGTVLFAIAVTAVAYLVASFVLGSIAAAVSAIVVGAVGAWSWFYVPLVDFERDR
jgi:hypothetical protein